MTSGPNPNINPCPRREKKIQPMLPKQQRKQLNFCFRLAGPRNNEPHKNGTVLEGDAKETERESALDIASNRLLDCVLGVQKQSNQWSN